MRVTIFKLLNKAYRAGLSAGRKRKGRKTRRRASYRRRRSRGTRTVPTGDARSGMWVGAKFHRRAFW